MSNVVIIGCGRVGSQLAIMLSNNGHNVNVIDKSADAFHNLGKSFDGSMIRGLGFDEETLIKAGIEEADVLAAVTSLDNTNLMAVEVASRIFHVPHVIARLYNPDHERAYMQLGLDYVCGTSLVAEEVFGKIVSGLGSHLETFGDYEILRFSIDLSWTKRRQLRVQDIERNHEVRIIAFERSDGSVSSIPNQDSVLFHGDTVLAAVHHNLIESFSRFIQN